jgi:hypothetical protein
VFPLAVGVPRPAHVFKVLLNIYSCDAAIREEEVINHVSVSGVSKTNKIIIQDFNIHWFNYHYDLIFESTLEGVIF